MHLTPREQDKLMLHLAGMLAGERKARGLKLNYPEATDYISAGLRERAREGKGVKEVRLAGRHVLETEGGMDAGTERLHGF